MLVNFFKITWRTIIRQKMHSFINIAGLAIGMTCSILILLWVQDELSYDQYHEKAEDIYRVVEKQYYAGGEVFRVAVTPSALAKGLKEEFPEIAKATRFSFRSLTIRMGESNFTEGTAFADPDIFDILTIPFVEGDPHTALTNPHSLVLTQRAAARFFGDEDPLGKTLLVDHQHQFVITGVIRDIPRNSHMRFELLAPFVYLGELGSSLDNWGSNWCYTYVLLRPDSFLKEVDTKIADIIQRHKESKIEVLLQPLTEIHLYAAGLYAVDFGAKGDIQYVRMFFIVAIVVLLIACVNFMNLATARSERRAKEVGLRKVVGAHRVQLITQFFGEAVLIALAAFSISLGLVELLMAPFNDLAGKSLSLNQLDPLILASFVGVALLVGMISGSYPALLLSSYKPVETLKGTMHVAGRGSRFRRVLVVFQFSLSICMIIGTLAVSRQVEFLRNKNLGLNKENLAYVWMSGAFREKHDLAKAELLKNPNITSVTVTSQLPTYIASSSSGWDWDGKPADMNVLMHHASVDDDYARTFQMQMAEGRFFSHEFATDSVGAVINETAARAMGIDSPVGKKLSISNVDFKIIGVVKDFHFKPIQTKIEPLVLMKLANRYYAMVMRTKAEGISGTIDYVKSVYARFNPDTPFHFNFLDDDYNNLYVTEQRIGRISTAFTILAIVIAMLGLYGLASYVSEQRTKEIGIRKTLGASIPAIVLLLSKDFVFLAGVANLIAWPAAYYIMSVWLESYAYRTSLDIGLFLLAAVLAFSIVLVTISFQAVRAARANPVDALRYE